MPREHISNEVMRAYLLGQLPVDQADALEAEYFADRAVFLRTRSVETSMIVEYLEGTLSPFEKRLFEGRYLKVPELQRRVQEVKHLRENQFPATRPWFSTVWRPALAAALALVIGIGMWLYLSGRKQHDEANAHQPIPTNQNPDKPVVPVVAVFISPGLSKGPGSTAVQIEQPSPAAMVNLVLELPGQQSPVRARVRVSIVKADKRQELVWDNPAVASEAVNGGQALRLQLPGSVLVPGDYLIQAAAPGEVIRETYVCHVNASR